MEQHKVLLIIVSVAIVLAAVVGVGLWLFYPREPSAPGMAETPSSTTGGFEWQPLDYLQGQGEVPGIEEAPSGETPPSGEFEVTYGVRPPSESQRTAPSPVIAATPPAPPAANAQEVAGGTARAENEASAVSVPTVPSDATGPTARTTGVRTATAVEGPPRETPETAPSSVARADLADRAYWVQAISSPRRDTVEQAKLLLREHQLGSRIITKDIEGRTYFRLRIGPFAVRAEAEKFLAWVQAVDGFADAMIFVDYTTPVLAARVE